MLNIFYGRESVAKEQFVYENIHGRAMIIVPDQFTLEAEQLAYKYLNTKGLLDVEIFSMSRLGSRLLSELGGAKQTFIDKYGRHMILATIAKQEKDKLQVFRGLEEKNSFIEMVNNFISEMKQYNCGAEELKTMAAEAAGDSYTQKKLEDLYLLYSRYEDKIKGKYTDSEDYIDLYLSKIKDSALIEGNSIWIFGFDTFAPKALRVIGQLIAKAEQVNVVLNWDKNCRDEELFDLTGMVIEALKAQGEAVGSQVCCRAIKGYDRTFAVSHLERELYALPARKSQTADGITLIEAAGMYNEAESAAVKVLELVRDQGLRYRDIRLICNDQDTRGPIITRVFQEYGIPVFYDGNREIMSSPVVRYVISLLDVVIGKYRSEDVFSVLKSGFGVLEPEEIMALENYAIKYRIRKAMWKRPFAKGESEYNAEGLAQLEALRQRVMEPFAALEALINDGIKSTADFISGFYRYLYDVVGLPDKIDGFVGQQVEIGRQDLAEETGQIWGKIVGILDQIIEILGDSTFDPEMFLSIFRVGLAQVEIGMLPPTIDSLIMGTMQRTRMGNVKALLVIGANEGVLPNERADGSLFSSEEKDLFKARGVELCKVDSVVRMEERLAIYRNLSKPEKDLWVSYSQSDNDGKESKPSSVFLKIKEIFPGLQIQKDVLNEASSLPLINGTISGLRHLTENVQQLTLGQEMDPNWQEALAWYKEKNINRLKPIRDGIGFTNIHEHLGAAATRALFLKNPERAVSLSPSRLERFSRCPFSHFISYGLRPEERRVFQVAPREIGDIYHECLMTFARTLTENNLEVTHPLSPWMTITRSQCSQLVRYTAETMMANYREGIFNLGNEEKYRQQRIFDICDQVCWTVIEQVRAGQIIANRFEAGFGRGQEIKPIEIQLTNETVYIEGKIDRVDYLPGDRVKIIDYKTGNEKFSVEEAKAGYRLQLMLYLAAACEEKRRPAGVFYFKIADPMLDMTKEAGSTAAGFGVDQDVLEKEIRKNFRLNGIMVDEPEVIESLDRYFSTYSDIIPLRASKEKVVGTGRNNLLSEEDFLGLQYAVRKKVVEICNELVDGSIDISPMKTKEMSACTYCEYIGICRFNTKFEGCQFKKI